MKLFLVGVPGRSEVGDLMSLGACEANMVDRKLAMVSCVNEGHASGWLLKVGVPDNLGTQITKHKARNAGGNSLRERS